MEIGGIVVLDRCGFRISKSISARVECDSDCHLRKASQFALESANLKINVATNSKAADYYLSPVTFTRPARKTLLIRPLLQSGQSMRITVSRRAQASPGKLRFVRIKVGEK